MHKCWNLLDSCESYDHIVKQFMNIGMADEDGIPGMKRALLEIIAAGVATTRADVKRYANCLYLKTCLAMKTNFDPIQAIQNTIQYLIDNEFVRVKNDKKQEEGDEPVCKQLIN